MEGHIGRSNTISSRVYKFNPLRKSSTILDTKRDYNKKHDLILLKPLNSKSNTRKNESPDQQMHLLKSNNLRFHYDLHSAFFSIDEAGDYKTELKLCTPSTNNLISGASRIAQNDDETDVLTNNIVNSRLEALKTKHHLDNDMYIPRKHIIFKSTINPALNVPISDVRSDPSSHCLLSEASIEEEESEFKKFIIFKRGCVYCKCSYPNLLGDNIIDNVTLLKDGPITSDTIDDNSGYVPVFDQYEPGALYYRKFFFGKPHENYYCDDERVGPIIISIIKTTFPEQNRKLTKHENEHSILKCCRIVVRSLSPWTLRAVLPITSVNGVHKDAFFYKIMKMVLPGLDPALFKKRSSYKKVQEDLLRLDEMAVKHCHKVGVILCLEGQTTENEFYNNDCPTFEFERFLSLIANKVPLKGFTHYLGGLDGSSGTSGEYSYYRSYCGREVMFHVSTEIPRSQQNEQQINRKRHIGNDTVTIIFQDGDCERIDISTFRSKFQHVFIIVRPTDYIDGVANSYNLCICRSEDVPGFGPSLPNFPLKRSRELGEWLINLIINADTAASKCFKLWTILSRARFELMNEIIRNNVSKVGKVNRKKQLSAPSHFVMPTVRVDNFKFPGGLEYHVVTKIPGSELCTFCILIISEKNVVFLSRHIMAPMLTIPRCRVYGWERITEIDFKLFYSPCEHIEVILVGMDAGQQKSIFTGLKICTEANEVKQVDWSSSGLNLNDYFEIGPYGRINKVLQRKDSFIENRLVEGSFINLINGSTRLQHDVMKSRSVLDKINVNSFSVFSRKTISNFVTNYFIQYEEPCRVWNVGSRHKNDIFGSEHNVEVSSVGLRGNRTPQVNKTIMSVLPDEDINMNNHGGSSRTENMDLGKVTTKKSLIQKSRSSLIHH